MSFIENLEKVSEIFTNEISVQVESHDLFFNPRKTKPSSRLPTANKLEFKPDLVFKHQKQTKSQFLSVFKTSRKSNPCPNNLSKQPFSDQSTNKYQESFSIKLDIKRPRRCQSGDIVPDTRHENRIKLCKKSMKSLRDKQEVVYSHPKFEKCPSAYQIPRIYDPLSNFSTKNLALKPSKNQPKSKIFKNYQACFLNEIDLSLKTGKRLKLKDLKEAKHKYYFRHAPKVYSLDMQQ